MKSAGIREFIEENSVKCEFLEFRESCHSVKEAAKAANANPSDFVKNVCLISDNKPVVVIVKGENRVSLVKVKEFLGKEVKIEKCKKVLEITGFPCGGIPSFGFNAVFLIDNNVLEKKFVYSSGGTENSLIKISPEEIVRVSSAFKGDFRQ